MRDDSSFIELKARQRAQALLDDGSSYPIAERRSREIKQSFELTL